MRHLIKITLIVVMVVLVLITFAKSAKSNHVIVDFLFKDDTGSFCHDPCLLGIHVGQPVSDALDQMSHNLFMKFAIDVQNSDQRQVYAARFGLVNVYRNNGPAVVSMAIDFSHAAFSQLSDYPYVYPIKLGDILTVLGKPSFVNYFTNSSGETFCNALYYVFGNNRNLEADVFDSDSKSCFSLNTAVLGLTLGPTSLSTNAPPWSGFASKDHYKRSQQLLIPAAQIAIWRDNRN